jgi:hypothetical protein
MVAVVAAFAAIAGSMVFGMEMPEEPRAVVPTATRCRYGACGPGRRFPVRSSVPRLTGRGS